MPDLLPDGDLDTASNQTKLNDIWWGARSESGAGKAILKQGIPVLGPQWTPLPGRHTTAETELSALPQNFANLQKQIAELKALITQLLVTKPGLTLTAADIAAIAKATNDDMAARQRD